MFSTSLLALSVALLCQSASSKLTRHTNRLSVIPSRGLPLGELTADNSYDNTTGQAFFDQYIDHNNPSFGTFKQQYYWSTSYWGGEGYPIILCAGQEVELDYYGDYFLTNESLSGVMAQAIGAAIIAIEHRYWGESSPYDDLTTQNLQYLTMEQNIQDLTTFAKSASLPFDMQNTSTATQVPWILMGGSYSGAVTAWTASTAPGTFWAYFASSAVVEAIKPFWEYLEIIQQYAPTNCSRDLTRIASYVDQTFASGSQSAKQSLQAMFGLQNLQHATDFASAIIEPLGMWQENQFYGDSGFFEFCDAIENATAGTTLPGAQGVGLQTALAGLAEFFTTNYLPYACSEYGYSDFNSTNNTACFNSYNASSPIYHDLRVDNAVNRQWQWMLCNEPFAWWIVGAPTNMPTIAPRLLTPQYSQRQCALFFSDSANFTFDPTHRTQAQLNAYTQGWNMAGVERLFLVNGQHDPWRGATVSSSWRPGGMLANSSSLPVAVIPGGYHCSDWPTENAMVNKGVRNVVAEELRQLKVWVSEWSATRSGTSPSPSTTKSSSTRSTSAVPTTTLATSTKNSYAGSATVSVGAPGVTGTLSGSGSVTVDGNGDGSAEGSASGTIDGESFNITINGSW